MNLFIYPQAANNKNGYSIGVEYAYNRITPKDDDIVIWYTSYDKKDIWHLREKDIIIKRQGAFSCKSMINIVYGKVRSELNTKDLSFLSEYEFENIYCDEVIFYRALRALFPHKKIQVRFHNCYTRIMCRNQVLKKNLGLKYKLLLKSIVPLETEIFNDKNVYKVFLLDEDRDFYCSMCGVRSDSETWPYKPDNSKMEENRKGIIIDNRLVWFGGLDSHKESSVKWFINEVLPYLKGYMPEIEFHLWGGGTERFDDKSNNIYGHGFYDGQGLPLEHSLYVNPDIIGGGIKLKLLTLLEQGLPFISTPFGFEGYNKNLIDGLYCNVIEEAKWAEYIIDFLSRYSQKGSV